MTRRREKPTGLPIIHDRAAGIDIGARFHVAAVPPENSGSAGIASTPFVRAAHTQTQHLGRYPGQWLESRPLKRTSHQLQVVRTACEPA